MRPKTELLVMFLMTFLGIFAQHPTMEILELQRFELPGTSIRAIEVVDSSELWFAGSNGRVGRISGETLLLDSISHENRYPHFRSIAHNGIKVYVLSIESPALLYGLAPAGSGIYSELVYKEDDEKVFYDSMTFSDNNHGLAMGDPTADCLSVLVTEDGGESWTRISCDKLPQVHEGEAAFAASNTNLSTVGSRAWMVSGGKSSRIWLSADYGKSWKVVQSPLQEGNKMTGIFTTAFYDSTRGIIMGGDWEDKKNMQKTKAITNDGGNTWRLIADGKQPGYISCVQYIPNSDAKELLAVSTEGVFYSSSAGEHWSKLSAEGFYSIRIIDKDTAWLSGHEKIVKIKLRRK